MKVMLISIPPTQTTSTKFAGNTPLLRPILPAHLSEHKLSKESYDNKLHTPIISTITPLCNHNNIALGEREVTRLENLISQKPSERSPKLPRPL